MTRRRKVEIATVRAGLLKPQVGGTLFLQNGLPMRRETATTFIESVYLSDNQGNTRVYIVEYPKGVVPVGIIINLHGGYGSGFGTDYLSGDEASISNGGFRTVMGYTSTFKQSWINVYPNAVYNPTIAGLCWNAGTPFEYAGVPNDVNFLNEVVTQIKARFSTSANKLCILGVSAGAMMALYYASEAYRQNFTHKPTHIVSINGVIAFNNGATPFSAACALLSITSDQDTIVPPAGGGFGSYMTRAAYEAICTPVTTSRTYLNLARGQHSIEYTRRGLKDNPAVKSLQTWIEDFLDGPPVILNLSLWLDSFDSDTITKTYQNLAETGSGTIGTTTITASATVADKVQAGMKLRIGGTDIYTVSTVVTTAITTVETLSATYNAGTALALDRVSQWDDKSGYAYHATQATALKQMIYNPARLNSNAVVTGDGASGFSLPSGLFSIPNGDNTIFVVAKRGVESGTFVHLLEMAEAGSLRQVLRYSTVAGSVTFVNNTTGSSALTVAGLTNTNYQILMGGVSGTTQKLASNNATPSTNATAQYESGINSAGLGSNPAITSRWLIGDIAMVLIYNRALTGAEIISVNQWISARTAITIA